jgi:hypothetical protein
MVIIPFLCVFVGKMGNKNVWKEIHNATIEKYSSTTAWISNDISFHIARKSE